MNTKSFLGNKLVLTALAGALTALPLVTAQAAPPAHAPAWGYRAKKQEVRQDRREVRRDKRELRQDKREASRESRRNDARNNPNGWTIWRGTVTENLSGNGFRLRTSNGSTFRVVLTAKSKGEPGGLSRGDYVQVAGRGRNGVFYCDDLNMLTNR